MKSLALMQFSDIHLTAIGLLIFFTYFCGVLIWVSRKETNIVYRKLENIPFEDGE